MFIKEQMRISSINNFNQINFQATKVASIKPLVKGVTESIDIYKLNRSDQNFLKQLFKNVKFEELLPNLSDTLQKRWQQIFNYCIEAALINPNLKVIVATCKDKLCGIMTYMADDKKCYIEGLSAIPDKNGDKPPFIGQTLFTYLFNKAKVDNIKKIELDAVTDGPVNVIQKYEKLGFKKENAISGQLPTKNNEHIYQPMSCNKYNIKNQLRELSSKFAITNVSDSEETDLSKFLD